jgi:hypothetical protein
MASWDEERGRVSQAFDDWKLIDGDQRAFLRLALEFATSEYDRLWREAGEEPYWEGGPEQIDSFEAKVSNLHQHDFDWMLLSGVLRDAVTSFEVYLEKAREETLRHQGQPIPVEDESPYWRSQKRFFRQLGIEIETDEVKQVRELRNFLTHRRGELRTEEQRKQYREDHADEFLPLAVALTKEGVIASMDQLAEAVRTIDACVYEYTWGRASLPGLHP